MKTMKFISESQKETMNFGKKLAARLKKGQIVCLHGDLGAGKTTLVKGLAGGFNVSKNKVLSPTFVLMNIYKGTKGKSAKLPIYHFDLYRLEDNADEQLTGYEEFFYGDGITVIEWADRLHELIPEEYLEIKLRHKSKNTRFITVKAHGKSYEHIIH